MSLMLQPAVRTDVGRRANNEDAVFATLRLAAPLWPPILP